MNLSQVKFDGLGTHWIIESDISQELVERAVSIAQQFESLYSRFQEDSLIGRLNKGETVDASSDLIDMLNLAQKLNQASEGYFDIRIAGDLAGVGYGPAVSETKMRHKKTTYSNDGGKVSLGDCTIDLGGLAKGYLIDRIGEHLASHGAKESIINGGGDIFVHSDKAQSIQLISPFNSKQSIGVVSGRRLRFASSSPKLRKWGANNKYHHIIDPITGKSSSHWLQSYVLAPTAAIADGLATAVLLINDTRVLSHICGSMKAEVLLVSHDGKARGNFGKNWKLNQN